MKFKFLKIILISWTFLVGCLFNAANAGLVTVNGTQYDILTYTGSAAEATAEIDFGLNPWFTPNSSGRQVLDYAQPFFETDPTLQWFQYDLTPLYVYDNTLLYGTDPGYNALSSYYKEPTRFNPSPRSSIGLGLAVDDASPLHWAYVSESLRANVDEPTIVVSDFANTGLDNWDTNGNGTVDVVNSPDGSDDSVMQMTVRDTSAVNEPVSSATLIDIPDNPFSIDFDFLFQTSTGNLKVWLDEVLLDELFATDLYEIDATDLLSASILVEDQDLLDRNEGELKFSLYPGSPAGIVIGEVTLNHSVVPEPSTLAIFALGMIGLASRRFKKKS